MAANKNTNLKGRRVGHKKRDMRWQVGDTTWASQYEYAVYDGISKQLGHGRVRKCTEQDKLDYTSLVTNAQCEKCGLGTVVQRRSFTPDLFVICTQAAGGRDKPRGYYIETKGYLRPHQRALLRRIIKCHPDLDLRFILQKETRATPTLTLGQWISSYLKRPWIVWDGSLPKGWT